MVSGQTNQLSFSGIHPQSTVGCFTEGSDVFGGASLAWQGIGFKNFTIEPEQVALFSSSPNGAAMILKNGKDAPRQAWGFTGSESTEPDSIKAGSAAKGTQPKITFPALNDRSHRTLRETFVGLPDIDAI